MHSQYSQLSSLSVATIPLSCRNNLPHLSQHFLSSFPITSLILPSNLPHLSQHLLSFFPITSLILPSNLPYMSQHSLSFFPLISPILPMNFPHSVTANSLDRLSPHYSFRSRSSPRTFPICRPRFPFCPSPFPGHPLPHPLPPPHIFLYLFLVPPTFVFYLPLISSIHF